MKITEKQIQNSTANVEVLVPQIKIDQIKDSVVDEMIRNITVKGFRQGKAPKAIAEKNLEPEKLNNHIINHLLNEVVVDIIKEKKYQTLGRPVLEKLETTKEGEVLLIINFPLYPEFKLNNYKDKIKKAKIKDQSIDEIHNVLLKNIDIDVSKHLVDEEVHHALHRLEDQAKTLNITTEKYLESIKKTLEQVKSEYEKNALESIKLDLILLQIAKEENLDASDKEVQELAKVVGANITQMNQVRSIIMRRKTVDFLKSLVA